MFETLAGAIEVAGQAPAEQRASDIPEIAKQAIMR